MNSCEHAQVWESFRGFYRRAAFCEIDLVHDPSSRSSIPYPFDNLAVFKQRIVDKFECRKPLRRRHHICEEREREVIVKKGKGNAPILGFEDPSHLVCRVVKIAERPRKVDVCEIVLAPVVLEVFTIG